LNYLSCNRTELLYVDHVPVKSAKQYIRSAQVNAQEREAKRALPRGMCCLYSGRPVRRRMISSRGVHAARWLAHDVNRL